MIRLKFIVFPIVLAAIASVAMAQVPTVFRPTPPTRDPHTPGYVAAKELPDGTNAPANADGNFILGPTHNPAPEMTAQEGVPQGTVYNFTMSSADSKIYPGIARDTGTFGTPDPSRSGEADRDHQPSRAVHAPASRCMFRSNMCRATARRSSSARMGRIALLFTALDNLIAQNRVPVMIAISIGNGSGDAQGSERGLEYDTMSGRYAEFVETRSAAAGREAIQREIDQRSRRPRDHGRQLRRLVRAEHGVVSPGTLSPRADVFGHVRESAVAAESRDAAWRVGVS